MVISLLPIPRCLFLFKPNPVMSIIRAIVAGEQNPQTLAALKHPRIKSSTTEIVKALTGDYRPEHLFVLKQELKFYDVYQKAIVELDQKIEICLASFEIKVDDQLPPTKRKRRKKPTANSPNFD